MRRSGLLAGITASALAILAAWAGWLLLVRWQVRDGLLWARRRIDAGQYAAARDRLARLSAWQPRQEEADYLLGVCEARLGRPDAALAAWSRVPPGSPLAAKVALEEGRTLVHSLGRLQDAEPMYRLAAQSAGPAGSAARWSLAELLLWEGRKGDLRKLLREIWDAGGSREKVAALRESWRLDSVIVAREEVQPVLDRAAHRPQNDDRVWLVCAHIAAQYGRYGEAREWLDRCASQETDPSFSQVLSRVRLQWALAAGEAQEARRVLAGTRGGSVTELERWSLRAWFAAQRNDHAAERAALEQLLALEPGNTQAIDRLATLALRAGETEHAATLRKLQVERLKDKERYRRLLIEDRTPIPQSELHERSRLAERLGRWFEARGWLTLALARDAGDRLARDGLDRLAGDARARACESPVVAAPGTSLLQLVGEPGGALADTLAPPGHRQSEAGAHAAIKFRDDAGPAGLNFTYHDGESPQHQVPETIGGGVAVLDYDGDGWLDLYLVQGGPFPPRPKGTPAAGRDRVSSESASGNTEGDRLFRNRRDGTFEDATAASGIARLGGGYGFGVTVGDYDNDGWPDLFVTRYGSYALLRNRGDGTFADLTDCAGLGGARDWPTSAAFADLDGDGDLDLYVCHYLVWDAEHPTLCPDPRQKGRYASCLPLLFPARSDHVFRNDGGHFVEVTAQAGIVDRNGRGLGVLAADLDGDNRIDLFVANDMTANFLFHNLGNLRFEEIAHEAGVACNADGGYQAGMGVACGDLDGDGRPDLAVTNFFGESTTFFHNLGHGMFVDGTAAFGMKAPTRFLLGFGVTFLDADNDGCLDLATANGHIHDLRPKVPYEMPAQLLRGSESGLLTDVSEQSGAVWSVPRIGRGLASADLDNDGRIDLVLVAHNSPLGWFHNQTEAAGHFLTIRLEGLASNRDAIGAAVTIKAGGRRQTAWRFGGGSYASASDPRLHFGLGPARTIEAIEVRWPSGHVDHLQNLAGDTGYLIREGQQTAAPLAGFSRGSH